MLVLRINYFECYYLPCLLILHERPEPRSVSDSLSQSCLLMSLVSAVLSSPTGFSTGQYRSYVGARATNSTSYSWSNGQPVARDGERESFWRPGSGDSHVGEPCLHLNYSGLQPAGAWEDTRCNFTVNNVVCEFVP